MGGGDLIHQRRSQSKITTLSCLPMSISPSCFPVKHEDYYTRIHRSNAPKSIGHDVVNRIKRKWRNLLRRLVSQRKIMSICGATMSSSSNPKRLTFHYDAVSYAQNFDEGCNNHEEDQHRYSISSNKKNNTGNNNFIRDFKNISTNVACSSR